MNTVIGQDLVLYSKGLGLGYLGVIHSILPVAVTGGGGFVGFGRTPLCLPSTGRECTDLVTSGDSETLTPAQA